MTTAERDRKEGIAQNSATAYSDYSVAQADAQLVRTTTEADADLAWSQTTSSATNTFSLAMAPALRNLLVSLAGDNTTFQIDKTTALVSYDNDSTASYESLGNDLALAESNWSNAAASASSAWSLADDNATITALNGLNTAQGLPWTQFLADKAVTDRDCSVSQQANDLLYAANVNNEYVSFEAAAGAELTLLVSNTGTATVSWMTDVAMAAETRITQTADAAQAQKLGLAPLAETYQNAQAQAERDNRVAIAQANRNYTASNDYDAYSAALETASQNYESARSTAASTYRSAAAPLTATRIQDVAQANHDYVNTRASENEQFAASTAQYQRAYAVNVSSDYETLQVNVVTLDANIQTQQSQSKATAMVAMETSNPSPWSTFAATEATAEQQQTAASTSATVQQATAMASAAQAQIEQLTLAGEAQATSEATNYRQYAEQMSDSNLTLAINEAQAILNSVGTTLDPPSDPSLVTHTGRDAEDYSNYGGTPATTATVALNNIGTNLPADPGLANTSGPSTPDDGQNAPDTYNDTEEHLDDFHTYAYHYTLGADADIEDFYTTCYDDDSYTTWDGDMAACHDPVPPPPRPRPVPPDPPPSPGIASGRKDLPRFPTDQGPTVEYDLHLTPISRDTTPDILTPPPDDLLGWLELNYPDMYVPPPFDPSTIRYTPVSWAKQQLMDLAQQQPDQFTGTETCDTWALAFHSIAQPLEELPGVEEVKLTYFALDPHPDAEWPIRYRWSTGHAAVRVTFSNGDVLYYDNESFSDASHVFTAEDIPVWAHEGQMPDLNWLESYTHMLGEQVERDPWYLYYSLYR